MQLGTIDLTQCETYGRGVGDAVTSPPRREGFPMSEYLLAVYLWSGVAGVGVAAPLTYWLVGETLKAVGLCHDHHEAPPPSLTSAPSTPGV